ncbi:MAG TPA: hypothetical protein VE783_07425 [Candidatus Limnocylindrales bacterium]|nr:hypothetical protein [Candidatus Limnocylindrales bacterium]
MSDCPMHAQHQAQSSHDHALKQRGDTGMGFNQDKTTHHFLIAEDGGAIQVTANNAKDKDSIAEIRMHLQHIASAFQQGDFDIPMFVHDQTPPGVPTLTRLKGEISYKYETIENGGQVAISSANPEALAAIREFLRFQIEEHKTGDPK